MRILFAIEEVGGGGKERRLVQHIKSLCRVSGYDVHLVIANDRIQYPEVESFPISIHRITGRSFFSDLLSYWRLCRNIGPDIVHTWSFKTSVFFSLLKMTFSYALVVGFIGDTFGHSGWRKYVADSLIFRMASTIISNSKAGLSAYKVPQDKGLVINNGFDFSRLSHSSGNKLVEMGISTKFKVMMLANVTPYKNYQLFIEVAEKITRIRKDVTFISVGEILAQYEPMVLPYTDGRHRHIRFLGFRSDVADLIKDCDLGVLCSYGEGISNSIIELMAAGVPVVTNDRDGGSKEVITHGVDGFIVSDHEVESTIVDLLNDESARSVLSANARSAVSSKFSAEVALSSYCIAYSNVIK